MGQIAALVSQDYIPGNLGLIAGRIGAVNHEVILPFGHTCGDYYVVVTDVDALVTADVIFLVETEVSVPFRF